MFKPRELQLTFNGNELNWSAMIDDEQLFRLRFIWSMVLTILLRSGNSWLVCAWEGWLGNLGSTSQHACHSMCHTGT